MNIDIDGYVSVERDLRVSLAEQWYYFIDKVNWYVCGHLTICEGRALSYFYYS